MGQLEEREGNERFKGEKSVNVAKGPSHSSHLSISLRAAFAFHLGDVLPETLDLVGDVVQLEHLLDSLERARSC